MRVPGCHCVCRVPLRVRGEEGGEWGAGERRGRGYVFMLSFCGKGTATATADGVFVRERERERELSGDECCLLILTLPNPK